MTRFSVAAFVFLFVVCAGSRSWAYDIPAAKYPLKVSPNGRHLTFQDGSPFLVVADAAWQLLRKLNEPDAIQYLNIRKSQAINTILIHLLPAQASHRNIHNRSPFGENNNLTKPDQGYFDYLGKIIKGAYDRDMVVGIIVSRKSWNSIFEAQGEDNCRSYGAFVSKSFAKYPNVIWVVGEEENQNTFIYKSLTDGIRVHSKGQLIAGFSSCSPMGDADSVGPSDLKFIVPDSTVSVSEYEALSAWQKNLGHNYKKPFVVANMELPKEITDQSSLIRNQAYRSVLSASAGFCHSSTIKNFFPTWKVNITQDGAEYLAHFSRILNRLPWELMQPDDQISLLPDSLDRTEISAFFLSNKRMAMLYIPSSRSIRLNLTQLHGDDLVAVWYSPRTGKRWAGGEFKASSDALIVPPNTQSGWDWILLIGSKNED